MQALGVLQLAVVVSVMLAAQTRSCIKRLAAQNVCQQGLLPRASRAASTLDDGEGLSDHPAWFSAA
jgi:hypothetical protein